MKKIVIYMVAILAAVGTFMSCGPMKATSTSNVRTQFTSDPSGATVMYDGKVIGTTPCIVSMPLKATAVNKGSMFKPNIVTTVDQWEFQFAKDGITETVAVDPSTVLVENGAIPIHYTFKQYRQDPTIVSGEASNMVSRDKPGQTALERTVIRWYFDSDPRGARIYWRVVSSIPSVVKNTNETYLMTTPFEETRSFNILGLTYENSRDVQIEIKVSKKGYEDQVKRFNVRQAIDQQEISGFFELVEKEE